MDDLNDIVETLEYVAEKFNSGVYFLESNNQLSYKEILKESQRIASLLEDKQNGVVGIISSNSPQFICSFFGILMASCIPTTFAIPTSSRQEEHLSDIVAKQVKKFGIMTLLLDPSLSPSYLEKLFSKIPKDCQIIDPLTAHSVKPIESKVLAELAIIQYTSGSTSIPKGVQVSHHNLMSACGAIVKGAGLTPEDINYQWLPLFHDMGLIGFLACLSIGCEQVVTTPNSFLRRPHSWLKAFAEKKATIYAGPQFSFDLMAKISNEGLLAPNTDLSCLRVAFNGAEYSSPEAIEFFLSSMRVYGVKRNSMFPVYGLAEATLPVAFPTIKNSLEFQYFDRHMLGVGDQVVVLEPSSRSAIGFTSVGKAVLGQDMIVCAEDKPEQYKEGIVGEICIRGNSTTSGYFKDFESTKSHLVSLDDKAPFFRTGDLGVIYNGKLFIVGRKKEIIKIKGRSIHPIDVESCLFKLKGFESYRFVAIPSYSETTFSSGVTVLVEGESSLDLEKLIKSHLRSIFDVEVKIVFVPKKTLPKTTSGKWQRLKIAKKLQSISKKVEFQYA